MDDSFSPSDTMEVSHDPRSSKTVLEAIAQATKVYRNYNTTCDRIDRILSHQTNLTGNAQVIGFTDQEYDLFWASLEILKPAIYAKPPRIVVSPRFKDGGLTEKTTADLIERVLNSEFERSDVDQVMLELRDDLAIINRGVPWVTYENDDDKRVCIEHLDRKDFLHEPARKWSDVGWVARRAYMTKKQMADRFREHSGFAYQDACFVVDRADKEDGSTDGSEKASVWEVWSKSDKRVYWVAEGVDVFLDEDEPHLVLDRVFPCPRPAYGTKQRRSLIPVPDYLRYEALLDQINETTIKIYDLLKLVKLRGLIPAGGDVGGALETAINEETSAMFIPVPAAAFNNAGATGLVHWVPIAEIATTITGLITARQQLFDDFYQLSGISDIMRGATESNETLGAQRLKGQYGSVRVRDKVDELVRVARDMACIAGEIICDNFDEKTLLEIAQMEIPTRREVDNKIKEIEQAAEFEIEEMAAKFEESIPQLQQQGQEAAQQAYQQFQQAQAQATQKHEEALSQLQNTVVIDDVMKIIKSKRTRALLIDIETDSTVMVDEMAEKQSRAEFLQAFTGASAAIQPLLAAGEEGAKLAGALLKFSLQPFKANRELDTLIDEFIDKAPELAAQAGEGQGESQELIAAQNKLAEAEMAKAHAAMQRVQADSQLKQVELQGKMQEMQLKYEKDAADLQVEQRKLEQKSSELQMKYEEIVAKVDNIRADTMKKLTEANIAVSDQQLREFESLKDIEIRETEAANNMVQRDIDTALRVEDQNRANRGEDRADRDQSFNQQTSTRQQDFAERQAQQEGSE